MKTFTVPIKCNICGMQTGEWTLDSSLFDGKTTTQESLGIADSRCDADNITHGTFKELIEKAKTKMNEAEAEAFVKKYRKKSEVEKQLKKLSVT